MNKNNSSQMSISEYMRKVCKEHPECKECPVKENPINIGGLFAQCQNTVIKEQKSESGCNE